MPTRNVRLAAIHSFFQYLATIDPRHLAQSQSILGVHFKRRAHRIPEYLERAEIQSLFVPIDHQTLLGQRDDALLRMLYNTGMRAQELADLDVNHLRFSRPLSVRIYGKGRKERICPLWKETVDAVRKYLQSRSVRLTDAVPLFVNVEGNRLSHTAHKEGKSSYDSSHHRHAPVTVQRRSQYDTLVVRPCFNRNYQQLC